MLARPSFLLSIVPRTRSRRGRQARQRSLAVLGASSLILSLGFWIPAPVLAATYTVTNFENSGAGSFPDAVAQANANPGADVITFAASAIGSVDLAAGVVITDTVTIDATGIGSASSPGFTLDGAGAGGTITLLTLADGSEASVIKGLGFVRGGTGILLDSVTGVTLEGNFVGTTGVADLGNGSFGIELLELAEQ